MADSFGLKIGIEGEKQFKQILSEINQSFKILGSEMQLVASQFDKNDKSAAALTARNTTLNKEIETQKDKVSTLKTALDNAAASFGENDRRTQNWQIQLNKAEAELNGMEKELKANNAALKSNSDRYDALSKEIEVTAREYVKVRKEYGENSAEAKTLEKKLKDLAGEQKAVGKAADEEEKAVSDVTKSLGLYQRETDKSAKETSVFGDVLKAALTAEVIKAGASMIVNAVKAIGSAVKDYVNDSSQMAQAAAESHTLLTKVMRNMMDATDDEINSLVKLAEQQEKNGVVSKTAQVTALAELASFVEKKEALEDMLPVMNDYIAYQYGTAASSEQARNVATSLGKAIMGNIDGLAKQGFTLSQTEKEWFKTATEAERTAFVIDMVSESMGGVNEALAQTDAGKMANLATVMDNTKIAVGTLANEFKAQIAAKMLPSISSLSDALTGFLRGEGSLQDLTKAFDDVFSEIGDTINKFLPQLVKIGSDLITALVNGISNNIGVIVESAAYLINQLIRAILQLLPTIAEAGIKLLLGLIDGVIRMLPEIVNAGADIVKKLAEGLGNAIPLLKPFTAVISGIIDVIKAMAPFIAAAAAGFAAFQIVQTITNMMKGLTVATAAHTVASNIQAAATAVVTAAQWLLNAAMLANPIGLIIAGVAALAAGITVLVMWLSRESEEQKRLKESTKALIEENERLNSSVADSQKAYADKTASMAQDAGAAKSLADKIAELSAVENKSAAQKQQLAAYVSMLNEAMGESVVEYNAETDAMSRNINEIYGIVEARKQEAIAQAARERAVEIAKEQMAVEDQLNKINRQRIELDEALEAGTIKKKAYNNMVKELTESEAELIIQQDDLSVSFDNATKAVTEAAEKQAAANKKIVNSTVEMTDELEEAYAIQEELSRKKIQNEQEVTEAMVKAASEQGLTLEEYKEKLRETEKELERYTNSATEMFKKMNDKSELSVRDMTENMKHNQQVLETWADNISALADRGLDRGLLDKLRAAGPESAGHVAALVKSSDKELADLNEVFANGSKVATDSLMKQLGLPDVVNSGADMVDNIAEGVDKNNSLDKATKQLIKDAKTTAKTAVNNSGFNEIGGMIVDGTWKGMQQKESWFRQQVTAFFKNIVNSAKQSLGIQSPSRVFAEIGRYMAEGLGVGFDAEMDGVEKMMIDAIPTDFDIDMDVNANLKKMGMSAERDKQQAQPVIDFAKDILQSILDVFRSLPDEIATLCETIKAQFSQSARFDFSGAGLERAADRLGYNIRTALPVKSDMPAVNLSDGLNLSNRGGSLITIQQMIVRSEDDIRKISQELYNLMQTGSRAQGRFNPV